MNTASKALLFVLLFAAPVFAQNVRVDNVTFSSVQGFPFLPGATITICTANATGLPCTPTVAGTCLSISDVTCNQSATLTSDALGNYGFWIQPGSYSYTVTKAGFGGFGPKPLTLACTPVASCTITGALTVNSPGSITVGAGAPASFTNLTASGQATVTNPCTVGGFIYVSTGGCYTTIPQAIAAFTGGNCGTIYLPAGAQTTNITINSSNACSSPAAQMVIQGSGRRSTILKPASSAAVITIDSTAAGIQGVTIRDVGFDNTGSGFTQPAILIQGANINDHHLFSHLWFKGFTDTINVTGRMVWEQFENLEIQNDADVPINVNAGANAVNFNKFHHITLTGTLGLWNVLLNCTGGANCGGAGTYIKNEFDFLDEESPGGVSTGGISLVNTDNTKVNVYCESLNNPCLSVSGTVGRGLMISGWMHNNGAANLMSFTAAQLSGQVCGVTLSPTGGGLSYVQTTTGSGQGLFMCPGNADAFSHTISADANGTYHTTVYGAYPPNTVTTSGSQTPTVAGINHLHYQNSSAATITNFLGGDPGQTLTVFNEGTSTVAFTHANSNAPFMPNGVSVTIANGGMCQFFLEPLNGRWVNTGCISGSASGGSGSFVFGTSPNLTTPTIGGGSTLNAVYRVSGVSLNSAFTAITAPACQEQTLTVTGAATTGTASVSPTATIGLNFSWSAWVSSSNTVTVRVCAFVTGTPTSVTWNASVIQ